MQLLLDPQMRGPYASKPIEQVVAEAEELAADGARELILVAQDTSFYGLDLYGRPRLAELLRAAGGDRRPGLDSADVSLSAAHRRRVDRGDRRRARKSCRTSTCRLQHINDEVLPRMRRRVSRAGNRAVARPAAGADRGLVLRTTLIAGFPGETEEQFEELLWSSCGGGGSSGWGRLPTARSRARRPPRLDGHLPEERQNAPPRPAPGRPAGDRLRLERGPGRPAAGRADRPRVARPAGRLRGAQLRRRPGDRRRVST